VLGLGRCAFSVGSTSLVGCLHSIGSGLGAFRRGVLPPGGSCQLVCHRELARYPEIGAVACAQVAVLAGQRSVCAGLAAVSDCGGRVAHRRDWSVLSGPVTGFGPPVTPLGEDVADERPLDHSVHIDLEHGDDRFAQLGVGVTLVSDTVPLARGEVSGVCRPIPRVSGEISLGMARR
jgi:hypothetical protein